MTAENLLLPAERGTRWLFGKPYHWHRSPQGRLRLSKGDGADIEACFAGGCFAGTDAA